MPAFYVTFTKLPACHLHQAGFDLQTFGYRLIPPSNPTVRARWARARLHAHAIPRLRVRLGQPDRRPVQPHRLRPGRRRRRLVRPAPRVGRAGSASAPGRDQVRVRLVDPGQYLRVSPGSLSLFGSIRVNLSRLSCQSRQ